MTATALAAVGSNANENGTLLISGTAVTASGTSVDFTGIPSWAKRVTVMFQGVSTNGTSNIQIQIGSGTFTTSGYLGVGTNVPNGASPSTSALTSGFPVSTSVGATNIYHGTASINLLNTSTNTWAYSSTLCRTDTATVNIGASSIALSGTLDRVRITTVNGTDAFDAGTINLLWE